jgi:ParB family chromosome partitioning protein
VSKRGLPIGIQMRHDAHYVEELSTHRHNPIGRFLSTDLIDPNPEQPRADIGDLAELAASIKENGILEPLLVKPCATKGRWMIIAGERRWRASKMVGLKEVPCIEMDVDDGVVAEIALIENLQRKDLTTWEEADGLAALSEKFGYTHEDVAKRVGKSRTTVTEALSIAALPEVIREQCRRADISAKSMLLEIARQPNDIAMHALLGAIIDRKLKREDIRKVRRSALSEANPQRKPKLPNAFTYDPIGGDYKITIVFARDGFEPNDIRLALEEALHSLAKS